MTFVDCWDNFFFIKLVLKIVIKLAKGSLNNIFQDSFNNFFISTVNSCQILYIKHFLNLKVTLLTWLYGWVKKAHGPISQISITEMFEITRLTHSHTMTPDDAPGKQAF